MSEAWTGFTRRRAAEPTRSIARHVPPLDRPPRGALEPLDDLLARQRLGPGHDELPRRLVGEREPGGRFGDVVDRHVGVRRLALAEDLSLAGGPVQADHAREPDLVEHLRAHDHLARPRPGEPLLGGELRGCERRAGESRRDNERDEDEAFDACLVRRVDEVRVAALVDVGDRRSPLAAQRPRDGRHGGDHGLRAFDGAPYGSELAEVAADDLRAEGLQRRRVALRPHERSELDAARAEPLGDAPPELTGAAREEDHE